MEKETQETEERMRSLDEKFNEMTQKSGETSDLPPGGSDGHQQSDHYIL